jgi:putative ABC transport system permease protein
VEYWVLEYLSSSIRLDIFNIKKQFSIIIGIQGCWEDAMRQAFRQFKSYPLQSVLIILAIALGVAVVTMVAASLQASSSQTLAQQDQLWNRELRLVAKKDDWGAFYQGGKTIPVREVGLMTDEKVTLSLDDLQRAKEAAPAATYAYHSQWMTFTKVGEGATTDLEVTLATSDYVKAARLKVAQGSLPSETDFSERRKVIVLSERGLKQLGVTEDILGKTVEFESFTGEGPLTFTVIGILKKPEQDFGGQEGTSFVPYFELPWSSAPTELLFAVDDAADIDTARDQLATFARRIWGERVTVSSNQGWDDGQLRLMNLVIAAFASTALVAASLNIMNLFLARVLKRSHDIGIQRSLGATANAIVWRFLSEALLLGVLGGILGVIAGYGLNKVYENYQVTYYGEQYGYVPAGFSPVAALIGFAVALAVSLLFGIYPAIRASRLRIIEALRGV